MGFLRRLAHRILPEAVVRRLRVPGFEEVERAERAFYADYVRDGMTVFDVGANVGDLTIMFSRLVGSGTVHAFEPASQTYDRLLAVLADENCANVAASRVALSDAAGAAILNCYDGPFHAFNTMADRPLADYGVDAGPVRREQVRTSTIDAYCSAKGIALIDLLKIDVEGAELQVLRGAVSMLAEQRIGCVAFEFGQATFDMGNTPSAITDLLNHHGYRITNLVKHARLFPGGHDVKSARFAMHLAMPR